MPESKYLVNFSCEYEKLIIVSILLVRGIMYPIAQLKHPVHTTPTVAHLAGFFVGPPGVSHAWRGGGRDASQVPFLGQRPLRGVLPCLFWTRPMTAASAVARRCRRP